VLPHSYITRKGAVIDGASRTVTRHRERSMWKTALGVIVAGGSLALMVVPAQADTQPGTHLGPSLLSTTAAHSASEAVAAEDLRLTEIRSGSTLSHRQKRNRKTPYTVVGAGGDTLVLTPRSATYTLADIRRMAPRRLVTMKDGSYLLSEHIAVMPGATLRLSAPGGLTLRLASGPDGFVSIVSLGGKLELVGQKDARLKLSSWDVGARAPDTFSYDGRAYVRSIDGTFTADYLDVSELGFWSGRTGGLAITGTARPGNAALERVGRAGGDAWRRYTVGTMSRQPAGLFQPGQKGPNLTYTAPAQLHVSNRITNTSVTGNAFGLFIAGTNGITISDTKVQDSLNSGVVLHRYVNNGVLSRTSSSHNAGDGYRLDRAATGITLNRATANKNTGSGFAVSGLPEADGPSVAGASTMSYGGNSITHSTASGNSKYGIHIIGGFTVGVQYNKVTDTDMGIVVTGPANASRSSATRSPTYAGTRSP
jgi:hypothetical protein